MGCAASRIDKEERVQVCKERKKLMKHLVVFRGEFANAQLAYLRALRDTGVTLRQFTESESLELEPTPFRLVLPPSPPPPLPPSPPPPPPFSPDLRKFSGNDKDEIAQEESIEIDGDDSCTPPPPPISNSHWEFWDPFSTSLPPREKKNATAEEPLEEENWAETNTEFEEEDQVEVAAGNDGLDMLPEKPHPIEIVDDNSSTVSCNTKDTADMAMVVWRSKKTLTGIVKELDDYFLKASAGANGIAVLMDINRGDTFLQQNLKENKRKRCNSAKVFSALSWSWSSKSLQFTRDAAESSGPNEPCMPGAHSTTLDKLYAEEQRLYKEVKEEESMKLELERKSLLLLKQEEEDQDWTKIEKARSCVESLESDMIALHQSINRTCSSILKLIDDELYPQLVALISGLMHMWRTMYECHQVQKHISQQVNHLTNHQIGDSTTDYHRQATAQLETEITSWHNSFCKLMKSQQDYVRALCRWIQLTGCLATDSQQSDCAPVVHALCEEWQLALDRFPDKVASEAIKNLLSAIHSIVLQQAEECSLLKKSEKLERRLQKELNSLFELENKLEGSVVGDTLQSLSPKHPLSVKRTKIEALKKRVEDAKAKYLNSVQVSRTMTVNNLQTSLPNVFQALMGFASVCTQAFEAVHSHAKKQFCHEDCPDPMN